MSSSTIPDAVLRAYPALTDAKIAEVFQPGQGWRTLGGLTIEQAALRGVRYDKTLTPTYARKLRASGVTRVAVRIAPGRTADFTIAELTTARRPQ